MSVDYDQAPQWVRGAICNGCGPYGWGGLVPDLVFKDAGNRHDWAYAVGGGWLAKGVADVAFLRNMLGAAWCGHWLRIPSRSAAACVYFLAVAIFGRRAFNFTDHPRAMSEMKDAAWDLIMEKFNQ